MPTIFPFLKQGKRQPSSPPGTNGGTSAPPKSQPSKHRPRNKGQPRSLRDTLLHSLPTYSGPYPVGLLELELPVPSPRSFGPVKRSGRHALTLETTLFNIFYPAALGTGTGPDPSGNKKWSRATWLPRPRKLTSNGYSTFSGIPPPAMLTFFFLTSWLTKIPAFRNAKIAEHWPPPHSARTGGEHVKLTSGDIPEGLPDDAKPAFPLLIFSHGLGGSRSVYSSVCGEFASYGFIVVAVEHRDGSGSRSVVNYGPESEFLWEEVIPRPPTLIKEPTIPDNPNYFDKERQDKAKRIGKKPKRAVTEALRNGRGGELVDEKSLSPLGSSKKSWRAKRKGTRARKESLESQRTYRTVDYLWPRDNPYDTDPSNKVDSELRSCQINMRKAELAEIYRIITLINEGNGDVLTQLNLKKKGAAGASSRGLDGVDWESWRGRIQIKNVTVAGHSFGAASTIEVLRYPKEIFGDAELDSLQGIIYDPWGAAIQEPDSKAAQIKTPLLGINSEAFMHWSDNFDLVQKVFDEASSNSPDKCWMMTLKGTVHISQSDFTIIYPRLCAALLKAAADPERAMDININASLEFLKRVMPPSVAEWNRVDDEGVLDVGVKGLDDEERLVRRPTGEGKVAKVLKKEKGWRRRMVMQAPSSVRRRLNRGKQMEGEVWMHLRPGEREDGEEVVKVEVPGVATENGGIEGQTENPQAREDSSSSDVRDPSPTGKKLE